MSDSGDPYTALDVPRDADASAIRKAYFRLVRVHTPEDDPERFQEITEAYEILSDPGRREEFDVQESIPEGARRTVDRAGELIESDPQRAAALVRPLAEDAGQPDLVRFAAASILIESGAAELAEPVLVELVERHPTHIGYVCTLVRCLRARGMMAIARKHLMTALKAKPDAPVLYASLAQVYMAADKFDRADQVLAAAVQRFAADPMESLPLHFLRVFVLAREDRWDELNDTVAAIDASAPPGDEDARHHVYSRWIETGQQFEQGSAFRAAALCFERAYRIQPHDRLRDHVREMRRLHRTQDEARGALDDPAVPNWIKALIVLVFGGPHGDEEAERLFLTASFRHQNFWKSAARSGSSFVEGYSATADALRPVRGKVVEHAQEVKQEASSRQGYSMLRFILIPIMIVVFAALRSSCSSSRRTDYGRSSYEPPTSAPYVKVDHDAVLEHFKEQLEAIENAREGEREVEREVDEGK